MEPNNCDVKLVDKDDYYKDSSSISFSALKVFSKCETLYQDIFVNKTYEEPEQDYFIYGKLVDAMVTEKPEFIPLNFVKVERKIKPEQALEFENKIKALEAEIVEKEGQINEKIKAKADVLIAKIKAIEEKGEPTPANEKKLSDFRIQLNDLTLKREDFIDKTLQKGIESRKQEILEIQSSLDLIKDLADKQQVTPSIWENAESTALALKTHPYYSNMEFNEITSQQIFQCVIDGIPRKGKLDHLKLSPAITKFYAIYKAGQMTLEELRERIKGLNHNDLWAVITDIKTCKDIAVLEPYNTHYRGQLGYYQDLVAHTLWIPVENVKVQILAADKMSNEFKKAEFFLYTQGALDELKTDVKEWLRIWKAANDTKTYVSSKQKNGMKQKCFTCSDCRFCPLSKKAGEPVIVDGPRFEVNGAQTPSPLITDLSTADALLDY